MYIHIGSSALVRAEEIIGIFDLDNTTQSRITRDFLKAAEDCGQVYAEINDLPKSFVLVREGGGDVVYLSQLASTTIEKRINS